MSDQRPWWVSFGWTARDYLKRVWDHAAENNVLFLAGGIAFNILLAAVPFFLLLVTGLTYLLPAVTRLDPTVATTEFIETLLPAAGTSGKWVHDMLVDVVNARGTVTLYSAAFFVWLSTRLFGSLRSALADVFDIESERGIIQGKIFDIKITVVATFLFVASTLVNTYIALATTRGLAALQQAGLRQDVMSGMEYWIGRLLVFVFIALMFFALYKFLPIRKVRMSTAWIAALFAAFLLEIAKFAFRWVLLGMNPQSIYTSTLAALVIVVVWVYYAALIFLVGGEVGQVYELRRMRQRQREVFS
jgi:membrane protein